jgi:hypothetical protein
LPEELVLLAKVIMEEQLVAGADAMVLEVVVALVG